MGAGDKAGNEAQNLLGRAKQMLGHVRGDRPQKNAGRREQKRAHLKKAGEQVKDAGKK